MGWAELSAVEEEPSSEREDNHRLRGCNTHGNALGAWKVPVVARAKSGKSDLLCANGTKHFRVVVEQDRVGRSVCEWMGQPGQG